MHVEREIKLRLPAKAALPRAASAAPARSVASVYYDTQDQRLRRSGLALRLRREGKAWLQTLKHEAAANAGLAQRTEWEVPAHRKRLDLAAFPLAEVKRTTGLDLRAAAPRLRPLFETRFTRRSAVVALDGKGAAELCVDRGMILARRAREPIREVELELKSGTPAALLAFAERLGLALAYESKAERGYRLAAGKPCAPRGWRMPALDPAAGPRAAFAALFGAALRQVGANAAGVLDGHDPEYLHQMRVGIRRLRSLLRAFAPVLKRTRALAHELRWLARSLAAARDWDVISERLGAVAPAAQARARRQARSAVASARFSALQFKALRWLETKPFRARALTFNELAVQSLERLDRKAREYADARNAAQRHALRIRLKRLRYAAECFAPAFPRARVQPSAAALHELQDLLGALNDIAVTRKRLARALVAMPASLEKEERRLIAAIPARWSAFERAPRYWRDPR